MQLLRPFDIALSDYTTSVIEDDAPIWDNVTTFNTGDQVIRDHRVYVSTIDGNLNIDPANENQLLTSTRWLLIGFTNAFKFVDRTIGNKTESSSTVTINIDNVDGVEALMMVGVQAATVQIQCFNAGAVEVYNQTFSMSGRTVFNYYQWFTEPIGDAARKLIVDSLPVDVTDITITVAGSAIEIGELVLGDLVAIGAAVMSPQTQGEVKYYGRVEFNNYGSLTQIEGPTRTIMRYLVHVPGSAFPIVKDQMDKLAGRLVGAIASDTRQTANQLGFLGTIKWDESLPRDYLIQFNVEGTT